MIFLVSIGILRTWGRGAGGGDTSKAIHRILIDATLKAFRGRIRGNLKNPISQLGPSSSSSWGEAAKTGFYPHPRVVKLEVERKSFARFLPFLPVFDFENWILGRFSFKRPKYSVRQNFVFRPMVGEGSNSILYVEYLHCRLLLSTPPEIYFSINE